MGERLDPGRVSRYFTEDGLPSDVIRSIYEDRDGRIWVGTWGGLAQYDQGRFRKYTTQDGLPSDRVRGIYQDRSGALWIATHGGLSRYQGALAALEAESYDLVLMDLQMPEMDGFEALAAIRQREQEDGEHQPVVALTAYAMKGDCEKCMEAGFDGYIAKPIVSETLRQTLSGLAGKKVVAVVRGTLEAVIRRPFACAWGLAPRALGFLLASTARMTLEV